MKFNNEWALIPLSWLSQSDCYRVGSGSACRSLYGGFVEWEMGKVLFTPNNIYLPEIEGWELLLIVRLKYFRMMMARIVLQSSLLMKIIGEILLSLLPWYMDFLVSICWKQHTAFVISFPIGSLVIISLMLGNSIQSLGNSDLFWRFLVFLIICYHWLFWIILIHFQKRWT